MNFDKLRRELAQDEGVRRRPYLDSKGISTVGIGHNLKARPLPRLEASGAFVHGLTDAEIDQVFRDDVVDVLAAIHRARFAWFENLDDARQRAVVNLVFNMGISTFSTFVPTIAHLAAREWADAAAHLRASKWARDVGPLRTERVVRMIETGLDREEA